MSSFSPLSTTAITWMTNPRVLRPLSTLQPQIVSRLTSSSSLNIRSFHSSTVCLTHNRNVPRAPSSPHPAQQSAQDAKKDYRRQAASSALYDANDDVPRTAAQLQLLKVRRAGRVGFFVILVSTMSIAAFSTFAYFFMNPESTLRERTNDMLFDHPQVQALLGRNLRDVTERYKGSTIQAYHSSYLALFGFAQLFGYPHDILSLDYYIQGHKGTGHITVQYLNPTAFPFGNIFTTRTSWKNSLAPIFIQVQAHKGGRFILLDTRAKLLATEE